MSVGKTRRVAASAQNIKRAQPAYNASNSDVEKIDTTNNVLIRDDNEFSGGKGGGQNKKEDEQEFVSDQAFVSNAINLQSSEAQASMDNKTAAFKAYETEPIQEEDEDFDEFV